MSESTTTDFGDLWQPTEAPDDTSEILEPFPDDFLWGAGTAAIQVEGCIDNSDWSLFTDNREIADRVRNLSRVVHNGTYALP